MIIGVYLIIGGRYIDPEKDISFLRVLKISRFLINKMKADRKIRKPKPESIENKGFFGIIFFTACRHIVPVKKISHRKSL